MTTINQKTASLLDRVYNLCGEDSAVFVALDEEQADVESVRNETSIAKIELDSKLEELKAKERKLVEEGNKLGSLFATILNEDFSDLINELGLKFDPSDLLSKLNTRLPETLDDIAKEKVTTKEALDNTVQELSEAITKLEELNIRRREAIASQELLRKYFELALNSNINITRDEITSIFEKCGFDEADQRAAAKLLMFPEDGLFDYMIIRNENPDATSVVDVLKNNKAKAEDTDKAEKEEILLEEEPVLEPVIEEEKEAVQFEELPEVNEDTPVEEIKVEEVESKEPTKDDLIDLLNELGLDYLDFKEKEFNDLLKKFDKKLYKKNVELISNLGIQLDIFTDNYKLLYDGDLTNKITKLTEVGKLPEDIYLNPSVLMKYTYDELELAINELVESGLEPKKVPLMAY